ncbi:MAG TPA: DNA circularization N-terminal domain-containing protein [Acidobacteriaceae bacterium]|jgi:prophage DNA circulation protein
MGQLVQYPWRSKWRPASFRGAEFHVETDAKSSGRRIALHEFPKNNTPYAEDMGKRATRHPVEGYCIGKDYLGPRDALIKACEDDGPGQLVHPLLGTMQVMCESYTCTETRTKGGFCTFNMNFIEAGDASGGSQSGSQDSQGAVSASASSFESSAGRGM